MHRVDAPSTIQIAFLDPPFVSGNLLGRARFASTCVFAHNAQTKHVRPCSAMGICSTVVYDHVCFRRCSMCLLEISTLNLGFTCPPLRNTLWNSENLSEMPSRNPREIFQDSLFSLVRNATCLSTNVNDTFKSMCYISHCANACQPSYVLHLPKTPATHVVMLRGGPGAWLRWYKK